MIYIQDMYRTYTGHLHDLYGISAGSVNAEVKPEVWRLVGLEGIVINFHCNF